MKRLFTALLAAVFAFAFAAPVTMHNAAAAGKDETMTNDQPAAAMDNAMKDDSRKTGDADMSDHKMKHHHSSKHHHHSSTKPHAKTNESAKTMGDSGETKHKHMHHDHDMKDHDKKDMKGKADDKGDTSK